MKFNIEEKFKHRINKVIIQGLVLAALVAVLTSNTVSAQVEKAVTISSDKTVITFSSEFLNALNSIGASSKRISPGKESKGATSLPIVSGVLDLRAAKGEMINFGDLELATDLTRVQLSEFITTIGVSQNTINGTLTSKVIVNDRFVGRLPLFALDLGFIEARASGRIMTEMNLRLTAEAATALNTAFNTTVFTEGLNVGLAKIKAQGTPLES